MAVPDPILLTDIHDGLEGVRYLVCLILCSCHYFFNTKHLEKFLQRLIFLIIGTAINNSFLPLQQNAKKRKLEDGTGDDKGEFCSV